MPFKTPIQRKKPVREKKKLRTLITPQLILAVQTEFHANGVSMRRIGEMFEIHRDTVRKIIRDNPVEKDIFKDFNPGDVIKRTEMPSIERLKLLTDDATQVVELTLAAARYKLQRELNFLSNNVDKAGTLDLKELTLFFEKAAPYVLEKKEVATKGKKGKDEGNTGKSPRGAVLTLTKKTS